MARSRRDFITALGGAFFALLGVSWSWKPANHCGHASTGGGRGRGGGGGGPHPDPRPDVDASEVLSAEELQDVPHLIPLYDGIRAIPHIADGIRCQCGCANIPGYRSLLICYESQGMATLCVVCQTEGRMVVRLHGKGYTLDQIRAAVDARLG